MSNSSIILSLFLSLIFFSCKNENQILQPLPDVVKKDPRELFNVELDLIATKNDSLQLYYKNSSMKDFEENKSVWAAITGSETMQKIQFLLPENEVPDELRLDFGTNKKQEFIAVKKFQMKYFDKTFAVNDTLFYQYFQPNEQINWDRKNAVARFKNKDGRFYDPLFFPRETLKSEIKKILR